MRVKRLVLEDADKLLSSQRNNLTRVVNLLYSRDLRVVLLSIVWSEFLEEDVRDLMITADPYWLKHGPEGPQQMQRTPLQLAKDWITWKRYGQQNGFPNFQMLVCPPLVASTLEQLGPAIEILLDPRYSPDRDQGAGASEEPNQPEVVAEPRSLVNEEAESDGEPDSSEDGSTKADEANIWDETTVELSSDDTDSEDDSEPASHTPDDPTIRIVRLTREQIEKHTGLTMEQAFDNATKSKLVREGV